MCAWEVSKPGAERKRESFERHDTRGVKERALKSRGLRREKKKKPSHLFLLGAFSHHPPAQTKTRHKREKISKRERNKNIHATFLIFHISMFSSWSSPMDAIVFFFRAKLSASLSLLKICSTRTPSFFASRSVLFDFCEKKSSTFFTKDEKKGSILTMQRGMRKSQSALRVWKTPLWKRFFGENFLARRKALWHPWVRPSLIFLTRLFHERKTKQKFQQKGTKRTECSPPPQCISSLRSRHKHVNKPVETWGVRFCVSGFSRSRSSAVLRRERGRGDCLSVCLL